MPTQVVPAALLELGEEERRPVGLAGRVIDLVGIVEERAKATEAMTCERAIERQQIPPDGVRRKVIDDVAFAAGRRALDELAVPAGEEPVQRPPASRRRPVQPPVGLNARRQVYGVA